jgi:peptide/nickel transport system permease protein
MSIDETHPASTQMRPVPTDASSIPAASERAATLLAEGRAARMADPTDWRSRARKFQRRFFRGKPLNVLGMAIIILFFFLTIFGGTLAEMRGTEYHPTAPRCGESMSCISQKFEGPSWNHWFGTDDLGRDVFSRVISGAKYSLAVAAIILVIAVIVGTIIGAVAGFFGGFVDELLMRVTDMFLAFPALILAIAISASLGPSLRNAVIALAVVYWPWYARLVRAQVLSIKAREYVEAARAIGASNNRVLLRHIMPNAVSVIIIQVTLDVGYAVLATAGLSFIGLGAQPPIPEWGRMITEARNFFRDAWWFITFPGIALSLTVLGFNLVGDGLRDYLDPRTVRE